MLVGHVLCFLASFLLSLIDGLALLHALLLSAAQPACTRWGRWRVSPCGWRLQTGGGMRHALLGLVLDHRRVLQDESAQLVAHVHLRHGAARLAVQLDGLLLGEHDLSLWVVALPALHEALDEPLQQLAQPVRLVRPVDDSQATGLVKLGLRTQLGAEILGRVCAASARGVSQSARWLGSTRVRVGRFTVRVAVSGRDHTTEAPGADAQLAGRPSALATSTMFITFVLMPLPRPSICGARADRRGEESSAQASSNTSVRHAPCSAGPASCTWTAEWPH